MEHLKVVVELAVAQTSFRQGCVYQFDSDCDEGNVVAQVGLPLQVAGQRVRVGEHRERNTVIVLHANAWQDPRFGSLPEFRAHRFEAAVSVPLLESGAVIGMVNFCRKQAGALNPREVALLIELGLPLSILMASPSLREQLARTEQRLADRKILERAKGLLQERLGYTEEQAYLHLRLLSRRRRIPMRAIAERVVEGSRTEASH